MHWILKFESPCSRLFWQLCKFFTIHWRETPNPTHFLPRIAPWNPMSQRSCGSCISSCFSVHFSRNLLSFTASGPSALFNARAVGNAPPRVTFEFKPLPFVRSSPFFSSETHRCFVNARGPRFTVTAPACTPAAQEIDAVVGCAARGSNRAIALGGSRARPRSAACVSRFTLAYKTCHRLVVARVFCDGFARACGDSDVVRNVRWFVDASLELGELRGAGRPRHRQLSFERTFDSVPERQHIRSRSRTGR